MTDTPIPEPELPPTARARIAAVALPVALAAAPWLIVLAARGRAGRLEVLVAALISAALGVFGVRILRQRRRHAHAAAQHRLEIERLALVDPLTGLGNRRAFERDVEPALRRARRMGVPLTLMCFDVDGIRGLNEAYGHACGDETLRSLGAVLRSTLRFGTDAAYRIGGDEFVALVTADDSGARAVAERVERGFIDRSPRASRVITDTLPWDREARIVDLVTRAEERMKRPRSTRDPADVQPVAGSAPGPHADG